MKGIQNSIVNFMSDEGYYPAINKLEKWHLVLEEMFEIANKDERFKISRLITTVKESMDQLEIVKKQTQLPPKEKGNSPSEYKAIAAWGIKMGSFSYYIMNEQNRAFKEGAPVDALYMSSMEECGWVTLSTLGNEKLRKEIITRIEQLSK